MRLWSNIKQYIKNLRVFHEALTNHTPYDYQGSLIALKCALADMEKGQAGEEFLVSVNRDKTCKRMRVACHALDRLIEDEYASLKDFEYDIIPEGDQHIIKVIKLKDLPSTAAIHKVSQSQQDLDLEIVSKFVSKYLLKCWS